MDARFEMYENPIEHAKACPFCATRHLVPRLMFDRDEKSPAVPHGQVAIECKLCGARGPEAKGRLGFELFKKAVELWNTRETLGFRIRELEGDEEV